MKKQLTAIAACALLGACASTPRTSDPLPETLNAPSKMNLGAFSVSLAVKDLAASREFYSKLGFEPTGGDPAQNWQVLRNGDHVIGLFQGMFPKNIITFCPGWTQQATALSEFTDVRQIQEDLKASGVEFMQEADPALSGPASLMLVDPDGNPVLIDQHVPKPN